MDDVFQEPVQFSKGINLREVMTGGSEFHIDLDFKKANPEDDLFFDDEEDSDSEDVLKLLEESTEKTMLASPEYHSFEELEKKMIDCDRGGNVKIMILEEGNGPLVPVDAEVTIHYSAYWEKASIPFDSTLTMNSGQPMRLRLGQGRIIPGLEIGLTSIKGPTARLQLLVQPCMAWGARGAPPRIKPEPALFVIALYSVRDVSAAARFNDLPTEEQGKFEVTARTVSSLHTEAKELFKRKSYKKAITNYQHSISVLKVSQPQNEIEESEVKKLKIKAYLNLALCYSKINKPKYIIRMIESLDYVTDTEKNCKALFYMGKANEMLGKIELAIEYYNKALKIEPKNKDIGRTLEKLDDFLKNSAITEKKMWQNAFSAEKKEKVIVDDEFKDGVRELFKDLAGADEFAKFNLPTGLKQEEIDFVKELAKEFDGLSVYEDGEGKKKTVTVVRHL